MEIKRFEDVYIEAKIKIKKPRNQLTSPAVRFPPDNISPRNVKTAATIGTTDPNTIVRLCASPALRKSIFSL